MIKTIMLAGGLGLALAGCAASGPPSFTATAPVPVAQTAEAPAALTQDVNTRYWPATSLMGEDFPGVLH